MGWDNYEIVGLDRLIYIIFYQLFIILNIFNLGFKLGYAFALNLQSMAPPIFPILKLLLDPDVQKTLILKLAYKQIKAIGFAKILAALLGGLLVGVSSFIKIPQIRKIVTPTSLDTRVSVANGLSLQSLCLDTFNSLISVVFNQQNGVPFTNYGESLLLGLQNAIIILLVKFYRLPDVAKIQSQPTEKRVVSTSEKFLPTFALMAGITLFFGKFAPPQLINYLQVLNIPINIVSKIPQIQNNQRLQSTAHLSDIGIRANVIGGAIRIFTSIQTLKTKKSRNQDVTSDLVLLAGYATSLGLSSVVLGQSIVFKQKEQEKKEQEKKDV